MQHVALVEAAWVAGGAAAGAVVRYGAHEVYSAWHVANVGLRTGAGASCATSMPLPHPPLWGVAAVNVAASGVLGLVAASERPSRQRNLLAGTGFCGGMSTFSTFALETAKLLPANPRLALAYLVVSNVGCIGLAGATYFGRKRLRALLAPRPRS